MLNIEPLQFIGNTIAVLSGGVGLWACVAIAKKIAPWLQGKTTILRVSGMALAALGVALAKASTGNLEGSDIQELIKSLLEAGAVWFVAHSTHKYVKT